MISYTNSASKLETVCESGTVTWTSPSNIALVKYWGKHGVQLPSNASLSFTLKKSITTMKVDWEYSESDSIELDFYFENERNDIFKSKIEKFLYSIIDIFPFLKKLKLTIYSENTFPHSAGIASSASSMSALALALCSVEKELFISELDDDNFLKKASYVARIGSGSACRSIYPTLASWGNHSSSELNSSDEFACEFTDYHKIFSTFKDSILIVDAGEKSVSSRAGHALMNDHPFSKVRFENANRSLSLLIKAMKIGDINAFGEIVEREALELHGLMMNSTPSFILMKPETLSIIDKVRAFRECSKLPLFFTLDAGPNVHLLYPAKDSIQIEEFISAELVPLLPTKKWIKDEVGQGPQKL